jgi:2-polyprenyl-3-methyl-5-hydroxy-6-metoxy-1,4-benzoquinol methylase
MRDIVVAHVAADRAIRLLDLGAGTGSLVFRLAEALPSAQLIGIDVSEANVRAAVAQQAARSDAARVHFEVANYFDFAAQPFDAIVSDGVLHLIPGDTSTLITKLAHDVRPGGLMICSMPYDCLYNRLMTRLRGVLRKLRSPWLDALILRAARALHGREMNAAALEERVIYMYLVPERVMNDRLMACFAGAGLHRAAEYPMASTSLSQLRHRVTVFVRDAPAAITA